jgi:hypothetical protein
MPGLYVNSYAVCRHYLNCIGYMAWIYVTLQRSYFPLEDTGYPNGFLAILHPSLEFFTNLDSSVGGATGCGLDDRGIWSRFPGGARHFSLLHSIHTSSLQSNGYLGPFPRGGKAPWKWGSRHPTVVLRLRMVELYLYSPKHLHGLMLN